ncbi:small ribosomal subunit protein uS9m-like [Littorina saxatilis]|uniref:Small ribosomal subunit protein uS9m n=1 Tax=Littorina saxatilis TaxID=31220 RepID=A0AAN9GGU7_9CAEN
MATSTMRRLCLLKVSRKLARCSTAVQERCALHTSCMVSKAEDSSSSSVSGTSITSSAVPDNLIKGSMQPKTFTKAQKISRAMQAYMERAQSYDKMIKKEIDEYDIGKRHLANIMGQDPDLFEQEDVDRAIEYLLPSGIFAKKARPVLKHPYEVFPKRKAAQFALDGRPFHSMFYTGKPNFYSLLLNVSMKIEELKKQEDKLIRKGLLHEEAEKKLLLLGSEWITLPSLKDLTLEPLSEHDHKHFTVLLGRLTEHPLAFKEEEFIMKHRRKLMLQSFAEDVPKPMVDDQGRAYITASGKRKTSIADVTVWTKGTGKITINGQSIQYFSYITHREQILSPLQLTGRLGEVDVEATVEGGGGTGQSGAIRLALAKALASFVDTDTRERMRIAGLLTRDVRRKERKKPGQKKARKQFTWKKR